MLAKVETLPTQQAREKTHTKKGTIQLFQRYPKTPRAIYMYRKCEMTPARKGLSSLIHTISFFLSRSLRTSSPCRNEWNAFVAFPPFFSFQISLEVCHNIDGTRYYRPETTPRKDTL